MTKDIAIELINIKISKLPIKIHAFNIFNIGKNIILEHVAEFKITKQVKLNRFGDWDSITKDPTFNKNYKKMLISLYVLSFNEDFNLDICFDDLIQF